MREGIVPLDYPGPVAADYPDCLSIVETKVRPEREKNNRKVYRDRWWQYAEKRPELYATIQNFDRFLVHPLTSKHHNLARLSQMRSVFVTQRASCLVGTHFPY